MTRMRLALPQAPNTYKYCDKPPRHWIDRRRLVDKPRLVKRFWRAPFRLNPVPGKVRLAARRLSRIKIDGYAKNLSERSSCGEGRRHHQRTGKRDRQCRQWHFDGWRRRRWRNSPGRRSGDLETM